MQRIQYPRNMPSAICPLLSVMAADIENLSVERVAFASSRLMASRVLLNQLVKVCMKESYVLHAIHYKERSTDFETDSAGRNLGE